MVIVVARFRPRADRLDEFVALLKDVQAASRADDGCLNYGYYSEVDDPLRYVAVEEWRAWRRWRRTCAPRTSPG